MNLPQPHRSDEDGGRRSIRCIDCGCWSDDDEDRCPRCGRRLRGPSARSATRREIEEAEMLPPPPPPAPPRPRGEPEWKEDLQRRLEGYREKQRAAGATLPPASSKGEGSWIASPPRAASGADVAPPRRLEPPRREAGRDPADVPPPPAPPPIVDRRLEEPAPGREPTKPQPAPLTMRLLAGLLDVGTAAVGVGLFLGAVHAVQPSAAGPQAATLAAGVFCAVLAFYWLFFLRFLGRTAGMSWIGLKVVDFDGRPPDAVRRKHRAYATLLSGAALGIGFAWALADEQSLTWHDRMSKTFVTVDE